MNKEIEEIIDTFKEYADGFTSVLAPTEESVKALLDYINQLETKINTYENPEDMTLMFMWCDEKAKDKIKQLEKEVERLKEREKLVTEHYDVMVRHAGNLEGKIIQLETNNNTAINFIDQELQYHLSPFDYKQVDEDINTLIGILRGKE